MTNGRPVVIRDAVSHDLPALAALEQVSFPHPWSREALATELNQEPTVLLVAADPKAGYSLLGYILLRQLGREAELLRIAVQPTLQRQGLGTRLLHSGLKVLAETGTRRCFLEVRDDNGPALALYARFGARRSARRSGYYRDGADAVVFVLEISRGAVPSGSC